MLLECGLVGLVGYLWLYQRAVRTFSRDYREFHSPLAAALGWTLVGLAAGQVVGNIVTQSTLWWFFFALTGAHIAQAHGIRVAGR